MNIPDFCDRAIKYYFKQHHEGQLLVYSFINCVGVLYFPLGLILWPCVVLFILYVVYEETTR